MKKSFILFAAAFFSAAAFVSCVEDDNVDVKDDVVIIEDDDADVPTGVVSTEPDYYDFTAVYNGQTIYFRIDSIATNECYVTHGNWSTAPLYDEETGYNYYAYYQGTVDIPAQVSYNGIAYNVTGIGDNAFNRTKLTDVSIPASVTSIGDGAFYFSNLSSVTIPSSVTSIGNAAFEYSNLSSVTIPSSVKHIGEGVFSFCSNLTNIQVESGNTEYMSENGVLYNKDKSTLVVYPGGKTDTDFTMESTIDSIADRAFLGNEHLTNVVIESNTANLDESMFDECKNFASIKVADNNPNYTTQDGVLYDKKMTTLILYPNAKAGESFTVPATVTTINEWAFEDCSNLRSLVMQNGLKNIGEGAFDYVANLKSITIPKTVEYIESEIFWDCDNLTTIQSYVLEPTEIDSDAFKIDNYTFTTATLYVPAGTKALYENTKGWNKIEKIVEMEE